MNQLQEKAWNVIAQVNRFILGKEEIVREVMAAFLAGGHILLEDIPGVGKTTMALLFSRALGLDWKRVQFTPDVMPSDLTGFSIYRRDQEKFVYQPGTVFCNLLLADEINRTSPKTQSALLEVMEEKQVTVEGVTRPAPNPFLVIATQNPPGAAGTQSLPAAQVDRFMVSMTLGYPDFESELRMAKGMEETSRIASLEPVVDRETFLRMQEQISSVFIQDSIYRYIVSLVTATRSHPSLERGASPRGTIALVKMARAAAWLDGKDYVSPNEAAGQFRYTVLHRISLNAPARMEGVGKEQVLEEILKKTEKPPLGRKSS